MLCERCEKQHATTHIKAIINGELTERHLCEQCAQKAGYGNLFQDFGFPLNQFLGNFLAVPKGETSSALATPSRCPCCGATFSDIVRSGKVGCEECYRRYYSRLLPLIHRIHGKTVHNGRTPGHMPSSIVDHKTTLIEKRDQLKKAIADEKYEEAAGLRDQIKALEKELGKDA